MNALLLAFGGLQPIVDAPAWVVLLLKLTAILSAAWLAHLAIANQSSLASRLVARDGGRPDRHAGRGVSASVAGNPRAAASLGRNTGSRCDVAHGPVGRSARGRTHPDRLVQQSA